MCSLLRDYGISGLVILTAYKEIMLHNTLPRHNTLKDRSKFMVPVISINKVATYLLVQKTIRASSKLLHRLD